MIPHNQIAIRISDHSAVGEARRISSQMAERAQLKGVQLGQVPLIATELATNLFVHAIEGEIIIRMLPAEDIAGIEIIAVDRGPGISDVQRCMDDGYSTAGTRGCGLGGVRRLSTEFEIYSTQPAGTVVLARVRSGAGKLPSQTEFSAINVPAPGESECGDAWNFRQRDGQLAVILVDGLGHGPLAAKAAAEAIDVFDQSQFEGPVDYFEKAHVKMSATRGAAVAIAQVNLGQHDLTYAGIGNVAGSLVSVSTGKSRSLLSHHGIVGTPIRKLQQFEHQWENGDLLIMHSDGLSERWKLSDFPSLSRADTGVIAGVLYRNAKRGRDDSTILVARLR